MSNFLENSLQYIKGIGPKRAKLLAEELNILSVKDLIEYFPYKHEDRSTFYKINEIASSQAYIQTKGIITSMHTVGEGRKKRLVAELRDETGSLELVWFKGVSWQQKNLKLNKPYVVYGKPALFGSHYNIAHPEMELLTQTKKKMTGALQAYYNTTEKLKQHYVNSKILSDAIGGILQEHYKEIPETLPTYLLEKYRLMGRQQAIMNIHFPENIKKLNQATYRLKFEELFYIQLGILKDKFEQSQDTIGYPFPKVGNYLNDFYHNHLPFDLTNAQKRVLKEIRKDLGSGRQMNRLLQGDVGSGKTIVALLAMLIAADNGYQSCLMAPTEILATQHYEGLSEYLRETNINVALLTGSTKKKDRKVLHEKLQDGSIHILIGTHALLEDVVQFKNLGFTVIDEQHRFGVAQRSKLWNKNHRAPHVLVMSATPIPRTLAMTVYGDLDVSVIDELPPGRKPIETKHIFDKNRNKLYQFIQKEIEKGRQIYVVYPMIKESEKLDYENLESGFETLSKVFPAPKYQLTMVHGQMKAAEKETAMQEFVSGKSQILVATTVIEVGVNVPNASMMLIESADRFGLSQLHQLRGRVGRGSEQSYCILITSYKLSNDSRTRMETMVQTNDGFEIAEVDMKLRGPGDIHGTQQSGVPFNLKIAHLTKDTAIMQYVREIALKILSKDSELKLPENALIQKQLRLQKLQNVDWSMIS
ncbi:ATP-dependent DNA helicase RecG [Balneicella halophila]|uniref:ATP-dependent DNA helicase RecG n=1 Tax=Balneicella halophila TaxID=1537566 RepID=A0A7L4UPZ2_BALHA|nr:ATP-dependent DNA helicase RecG [Balneicella halophila]PVX50876.1 ATP-dependent DNA helicase RecG [Balneicella halophila]